MYRNALGVALLVVLAAPAQGGWDEGWDAYERRDYATATREFIAKCRSRAGSNRNLSPHGPRTL